jgi:glycerophosphoryl diester phosphodiesterase
MAPLPQPKPLSNTERLLAQLQSGESKNVFVVAHRGDWRNAPENSLEAVARSIEMGVDIVELDVRQTKDGHIVVMHDSRLDRTTTGSGLVKEHSLQELRELRLKNGIGKETDHSIPTLEEMLQLTKDQILVNLDKVRPDMTGKAIEAAVRTGTINQVVFKGHQTYQAAREIYGEWLDTIFFMPVIDQSDKEAVIQSCVYLDQLDPVIFEILFSKFSSDIDQLMQLLRERGKQVWVNTLTPKLCAGQSDDRALVNPDAIWGALIERGVSVIQTDRPRELLDYLRDMGRHD